MRSRSIPLPGWNILFALLALLALAGSVVVPRGYMAETSHQGLVRITLCTGNGPAEIFLPQSYYGLNTDTDQHDDADQDNRQHGIACPYAGNIAPLNIDDTNITTPALFIVAAAVIGGVRLLLTPGRGMAAPPPPAQGPPVSFT